MSWAARGIPGAERIVEYEAGINRILTTTPMSVLCDYDLRRFDGATNFAVLGLHSMLSYAVASSRTRT